MGDAHRPSVEFDALFVRLTFHGSRRQQLLCPEVRMATGITAWKRYDQIANFGKLPGPSQDGNAFLSGVGSIETLQHCQNSLGKLSRLSLRMESSMVPAK